jgi:dihydropyrimidinase
MHDLILRNGLLITSNGPIQVDVAVQGETISAIGQELAGRRTIDATGCYLLPGAIDQHVHMQMPLTGRISSDSFATGTLAAACGGTTTIIDFVAPDAGQGLLDALAARRAEADGQVVIDYGLHMTIPTWHAAEDSRMSEIPEVVAAGCPTFKMYQAYPDVMLDDASLLRAMQQVAAAGGSVVLHSETGPVLDVLRNQALAQGHTEAIWHERTRPARLEATAIQRAAELAHLAGCRLLIFHVGCAESVAAIAEARRRGIDISGESCPQYLLLNADDHLGGADGNLFICAPPLRSAEHQPSLWQALADDDLQVVSTDHCPWTRAEKAQVNFTLVPGGVPSIECRLALLHHFGVNQRRLSLERWVQVCCTNPARLMGLAHKGRLAPGYDADIIIFDPMRAKTIHKAALHEAADWTPYEGIDVVGWPRTVLLRGQVIVEEERVVGQPGAGCFVARK